MKSDVECITIVSIIIIILFCIIYDPSTVVCVALAISILITMIKRISLPISGTDIFIPSTYKPAVPVKPPPTKEEAAIYDAKSDHGMANMSDENRWALDQLYGRRGTPINDRMTEHYKRIGSRDEKAVVTQIRARRNNSVEPFYRQELSQHANKRWWDPDPILSMKATPEQQATIMKGPMPNW